MDEQQTGKAVEEFDVLIVGAGLSGIGTACHLQTHCPGRSYAILESRGAIGGTWDLFRYPGVRSDSDMYTLGYSFEPWTGTRPLADGASILRYLRDVASKHRIDRHIRFHHAVRRADWCSKTARWTVEVERSGQGGTVRFRCRWLHMASGYYDYGQAHVPDFSGRQRFRGAFVVPQFWPDDLDTAGKRIVVIGSGATAVTLVPALARTAAHVTMLQRSPSYIVSLPARDPIAAGLRRLLGPSRAYPLVRWKNVLLQMLLYRLARRRPEWIKRRMIRAVSKAVGPEVDVATHFTPRYNPWDQRVCLVPDADLFEAIRSGRVSMVTGEVAGFVEDGVQLADGRKITADIVVAATGLTIKLLSGVHFRVDGQLQDLSKSLIYKGMMFSDVPNLSYSFGYTNASWTLKADLIAAYLTRLLNRMAESGCAIAVARREPGVEEVPFVDFTSGYVQRALPFLPKQGARRPWRLYQNYALDLAALKWGRLEDGVLQFRRCGQQADHLPG